MDFVSENDLKILRGLGERLRQAAESKVMAERRRAWQQVNALKAYRPPILFDVPMGEVHEHQPLQCRDEWARNVEKSLMWDLYHVEDVGDDWLVGPYAWWTPPCSIGDYGVEVVYHTGDDGAGHGSKRWDPPITDIEKGLKGLHFREVSLDVGAGEQQRDRLAQVFEGLLTPRLRPWYWWTTGLTIECVALIGIEGLMLAMYDQPEALHRLMAFLRDDQLHLIETIESLGVLNLMNQEDLIGSGAFGYTDELPQKDWTPDKPVRLKDIWGLSESQETVSVSPEMFAEFVFPYQLPLTQKFGLICYGCCEPLESRWDIVKQIPNLRRVSVAPWADQARMAEQLGRRYVYSRKPNPAIVCKEVWDESQIRDDLRKTLAVTRQTNLEIVMKDVSTLHGEVWRARRWAEIAREEVSKVW